LTIDPEFSADFSIEELNTSLLTKKPGKAAGFNEIYPEVCLGVKTRVVDGENLTMDFLLAPV
jgi:hypothetical protein